MRKLIKRWLGDEQIVKLSHSIEAQNQEIRLLKIFIEQAHGRCRILEQYVSKLELKIEQLTCQSNDLDQHKEPDAPPTTQTEEV